MADNLEEKKQEDASDNQTFKKSDQIRKAKNMSSETNLSKKPNPV